MTPRPHLTTQQLAERFGRSYRWVTKHIDDTACVPTPIRIGNRWMWRQSDVAAWEDKHKLGRSGLRARFIA